MGKNPYQIIISYDSSEKGYIASIPKLDKIAAFGHTKEEAIKNVKKVQRDYLKFLKANNKAIPEPDNI